MITHINTTRLLLICLTTIVLICSFAAWRLTIKTNELKREQETALQIAKTATAIIDLRQKNPKRNQQHSEILNWANLAEHSAKASGFSPNAIERITPEPDQKIPDSPYVIESCTLYLRGITLKQLPQFIKQFNQNTPNDLLTVQRIRLVAPRRIDTPDGVEKWDVQTVLSRKKYPLPNQNEQKP